ncbi:MAG: hypothetical protein HRU18_27830 [Pseudoalteromonas sp.]|nr:hypothetical protein [Pseudoalteromonas sp.]
MKVLFDPILPGTCVTLVNVGNRQTRDGEPLTDGAWYVHTMTIHHREGYLYSLLNNEGHGVGSIPHRCLLTVLPREECSLSYTVALRRWLGVSKVPNMANRGTKKARGRVA